MREPRVYIDDELACGQTLALPPDAIHHISRVLRMRAGQRLWLFNGSGGSYLAEVVLIDKRQAQVRLLEFSHTQPESSLQITLAQGVSRGQHMDYTLQKAVELGVKRIVPVFTEFGNVQLDAQRQGKKLQHWQKIIISACEQCGRNILPAIATPLSLAEWLQQDINKLKLLLHPGSARRLSAQKPPDQSISLLSGPEGGFSQSEVELSRDSGYLSVELGPRVLRTETAAIAAISACQTLWGDMG
jgi:16S rRNA (uracil1498-N3)-methyltransferase